MNSDSSDCESYGIAFTESAWSDYQKVRVEPLARAISALADDPYPDGNTVFENPDAEGPFDGDYILRLISDGIVHRVRYYLDRSTCTLYVVAVDPKPQRFGLM